MVPRKLLMWLAFAIVGWTLAATVAAQVYANYAERIMQTMLIGVAVVVIIAAADFFTIYLQWRGTSHLLV